MSIRRSTLLLGLAVVVGIAVVAALFHPFLYPDSEAALDDGPVVALGGSPDRAEVAAQIVEGSERERELLLSHPPPDEVEPGGRCTDAGVRCIWPQPVSTWGEAQAIARLAEEEGWEGVTVVTDDFHLARSRSLLQRCSDVPVRVVGTGDEARGPVGLALREAAATTVSLFAYRDC